MIGAVGVRRWRRKEMGKTVRLTARDGHTLDAYVAEPKGQARGAIVVVQEISA
jgi:dienelactone hydrolase